MRTSSTARCLQVYVSPASAISHCMLSELVPVVNPIQITTSCEEPTAEIRGSVGWYRRVLHCSSAGPTCLASIAEDTATRIYGQRHTLRTATVALCFDRLARAANCSVSSRTRFWCLGIGLIRKFGGTLDFHDGGSLGAWGETLRIRRRISPTARGLYVAESRLQQTGASCLGYGIRQVPLSLMPAPSVLAIHHWSRLICCFLYVSVAASRCARPWRTL